MRNSVEAGVVALLLSVCTQPAAGVGSCPTASLWDYVNGNVTCRLGSYTFSGFSVDGVSTDIWTAEVSPLSAGGWYGFSIAFTTPVAATLDLHQNQYLFRLSYYLSGGLLPPPKVGMAGSSTAGALMSAMTACTALAEGMYGVWNLTGAAYYWNTAATYAFQGDCDARVTAVPVSAYILAQSGAVPSTMTASAMSIEWREWEEGVDVAVVPEPSTVLLLATGLLAIGAAGWIGRRAVVR